MAGLFPGAQVDGEFAGDADDAFAPGRERPVRLVDEEEVFPR